MAGCCPRPCMTALAVAQRPRMTIARPRRQEQQQARVGNREDLTTHPRANSNSVPGPPWLRTPGLDPDHPGDDVARRTPAPRRSAQTLTGHVEGRRPGCRARRGIAGARARRPCRRHPKPSPAAGRLLLHWGTRQGRGALLVVLRPVLGRGHANSVLPLSSVSPLSQDEDSGPRTRNRDVVSAARR